MGRFYSASFGNRTFTAAGDVMDIKSAAAAVTIIHSVFVGQSTRKGDAQAEMWRMSISRYGTAGTGTAITPSPLDPGYAAYGGTVRKHSATGATTLTELVSEAMNVQVGWWWKPAPEGRIILGGGDGIVVRLESTPIANSKVDATVVLEEIG